MVKLLPKVRCCYVTVETINAVEEYLVPARDHQSALDQFKMRTDATLSAKGNHQLVPVDVYEDGTRFEFLDGGRYHYFEPGVPGYDYLTMEYRKIAREYEAHRQKDAD